MRSTARDEDAHINIASQSRPHRYRQAVHQAQQADRSADQQHEEHLAALQALAADVSSGNDLKRDSSATASPGYADRVRRLVRPNVVAPIDIDGNPSAVIAVRCAPDGSLLNVAMQRLSSNPQWDIAALSSIEKSDPMPRDVSGSAPASFLITIQPKGGFRLANSRWNALWALSKVLHWRVLVRRDRHTVCRLRGGGLAGRCYEGYRNPGEFLKLMSIA
jgi:hypothetical protein